MLLMVFYVQSDDCIASVETPGLCVGCLLTYPAYQCIHLIARRQSRILLTLTQGYW
jgi:hypothetical protein